MPLVLFFTASFGLFAASWVWLPTGPHWHQEYKKSGLCAQSLNCVNSLWPHKLEPIRLLYPWNFPGKNTGAGCLLQGIFLTQGLASPASLAFAGKFFTIVPPGKLRMDYLLLTTCTTLFGPIGAGWEWGLSSSMTPLTPPWWEVLEHVLLLQRGTKSQLLAYPTDVTPARRLGVHPPPPHQQGRAVAVWNISSAPLCLSWNCELGRYSFTVGIWLEKVNSTKIVFNCLKTLFLIS